MEAPDPNPMPEVNLGLVDKAKEIGQRLIGLCSYFPETGYHSNHVRGASEMLDAALDQPARLPGFDGNGDYRE